MNVLFVEDNPVCQEMVKNTTEKDFPVVKLTCCETLADARRLVERMDVVVLDLGLPDATYEEVFEWISECGKPVVIYTASTEPEMAFEAVRAGALNIVCKGSPSEQLVIGMYVAIAEHQLQNDEKERRREIANRLSCVLSKWCDRFSKSLDGVGASPAREACGI